MADFSCFLPEAVMAVAVAVTAVVAFAIYVAIAKAIVTTRRGFVQINVIRNIR